MFHTSESIDLIREVLTFWVHNKSYRALVMRRYLDSKYKCYLLDILDFIMGLLNNIILFFVHIVQVNKKFN